MSQRLNNIIVFILILIGSILILLWNFYFDLGTLNLYGEKDFSVYLKGYKKFKCSSDPCKINLKSGKYSAVISKNGYKDFFTEISIKRRAVSSYNFNFEIIPTFIQVNEIPTKPPIVKVLPDIKEKILAGKWNKDSSKFAYILENPQNLFLKMEGKTMLITTFYALPPRLGEAGNPPSLIFSPNDLYILIKTNSELFLVDVLNKLKYQILENFEIDNILWAPLSLSFLFSDNGNNIYLYNIQTKKYDVILKNTEIKNILWIADEYFIYFGKGSFYKYNIKTLENTFFVSAPDIKNVNMYLDETDKKVYFENEGKFYELIF